MRASRSALARPVGLRPLLLAALAALGRGGFVGRGHGLIITRGSSKPAPGLGQAVREQAVVAMRASEPTQAAALAPQCGDHCFVLEVDLGNGAGVVHQELAPLFSESELLTVRMPVPCELHAEASHGVLRISVNGHGLYAGDVLRACSTFRAKLADVWLGLVPVSRPPGRCCCAHPSD